MQSNKGFEFSNQLGEYALQIKAGRIDLFSELFKVGSSYSFYTARKYVDNDHDAKDIVQDAYIKIIENFDSLQDPRRYLGWMKRIIINLALNFNKKVKPDLYLNQFESEEAFFDTNKIGNDTEREAAYLVDGSRETLHYLLNSLPYKHKEVLLLFYMEGMNITEIAKMLDISEGTVKSRLYHARITAKRL